MKHTVANKEYNLWVLLSQARHAMFKARQKELTRYNISPRESATLFIIESLGKRATVAEVGRWLFRESHTTSELLSRMEKDGLVRRVKDLERKNLVRVELTEKGRKAYTTVMKRESILKVMSVLSNEERRQLVSTLLKLRDVALKETGEERKIPFPPTDISNYV